MYSNALPSKGDWWEFKKESMYRKEIDRKLSYLAIALILFFAILPNAVISADSPDFFDKSGDQIQALEGDTVKAEFWNTLYRIKFDDVEDGYVTIYVNDEGPRTIREGESGLFNISEGVGVSIEVMGISGDYANLRLRRVQGIKPAEEPKPVIQGYAILSGQESTSDIAEEKPAGFSQKTKTIAIVVALILILLLVRYLAKRKVMKIPEKTIVRKSIRKRRK